MKFKILKQNKMGQAYVYMKISEYPHPPHPTRKHTHAPFAMEGQS